MHSIVESNSGTRLLRLDGIRALAILLVFCTHAQIWKLGWVGVHLFFVLSGFLITTILRRSREEAAFWGPFYIKRATRIVPALLIAFVGAALFSSVRWSQVGLYEAFFLANVAQTLHQGETGTLGVLWSLAVEEQFYFLWPLAIRFLSRSQLLMLVTIILVVEPILRGAVTPMFRSFWPIFYLTPFQLDGLAAGSGLALLLESDHNRKLLSEWSGVFLAVASGSFLSLSLVHGFYREANSVLFNSIGYSLITLTACGLVALTLLRSESQSSKLLQIPAVAFVGSISYGLYLFHPIGLELMNRAGMLLHFHHNRILAPITLTVVGVFSWLSFRFYEKPILLWGRHIANNLPANIHYRANNIQLKNVSVAIDPSTLGESR